MDSINCLGVKILLQPKTAQALRDEFDKQQNDERQLQRSLAVNKIAVVLGEAKVCSDPKKTKKLAENILDRGLDIQANVLPTGSNVSTDVKRIVQEYHKRFDHVYFFGNAPVKSNKLSHEQDQHARQFQIQNFRNTYVGTITKRQAHEEVEEYVNSYAELYSKTEEFVEKKAAYSCSSSFFFNGHGSKEGLHFENGDVFPLFKYISDLKDLASRFKLKNVRLIFAQCHGYLFSPDISSLDFKVHSLSNVDKPLTFYTVEHDDNICSTISTEYELSRADGHNHRPVKDSSHLDLEGYAEEKNKEEVRASEILPSGQLDVDDSKTTISSQRSVSFTDTEETTKDRSVSSTSIADSSSGSFPPHAYQEPLTHTEHLPVAETGNGRDLLAVEDYRSPILENVMARPLDTCPSGQQVPYEDRDQKTSIDNSTVDQSDSTLRIRERQADVQEHVTMHGINITEGNQAMLEDGDDQHVPVAEPTLSHSEPDDEEERSSETVTFSLGESNMSTSTNTYRQQPKSDALDSDLVQEHTIPPPHQTLTEQQSTLFEDITQQCPVAVGKIENRFESCINHTVTSESQNMTKQQMSFNCTDQSDAFPEESLNRQEPHICSDVSGKSQAQPSDISLLRQRIQDEPRHKGITKEAFEAKVSQTRIPTNYTTLLVLIIVALMCVVFILLFYIKLLLDESNNRA